MSHESPGTRCLLICGISGSKSISGPRLSRSPKNCDVQSHAPPQHAGGREIKKAMVPLRDAILWGKKQNKRGKAFQGFDDPFSGLITFQHPKNRLNITHCTWGGGASAKPTAGGPRLVSAVKTRQLTNVSFIHLTLLAIPSPFLGGRRPDPGEEGARGGFKRIQTNFC